MNKIDVIKYIIEDEVEVIFQGLNSVHLLDPEEIRTTITRYKLKNNNIWIIEVSNQPMVVLEVLYSEEDEFGNKKLVRKNFNMDRYAFHSILRNKHL